MVENNRWLDADNQTTSSDSSVIHWHGPEEGICTSVLSDGEVWINCRRKDYTFWVGRASTNDPWRLNLLLPSSEVLASHYPSRALRRSFYPDFLVRRDSLLDAIAKPYFELLSVEHEPTDTYPNLFKVVFDYEHPFQRTGGDYQYNWVQKGTMWLDADNCWVIVRILAEYLGSKNQISWHEKEFEFDAQPYRGIRLPVESRGYDLNKDWQRMVSEEYYVQEFGRIEPDELDPQTMNLSHYGFAEPDFDSSDRLIEIRLEEDREFPLKEQSSVPFTVRNISSHPLSIVRVAAC